jgi:hypothetical protein
MCLASAPFLGTPCTRALAAVVNGSHPLASMAIPGRCGCACSPLHPVLSEPQAPGSPGLGEGTVGVFPGSLLQGQVLVGSCPSWSQPCPVA